MFLCHICLTIHKLECVYIIIWKFYVKNIIWYVVAYEYSTVPIIPNSPITVIAVKSIKGFIQYYYKIEGIKSRYDITIW